MNKKWKRLWIEGIFFVGAAVYGFILFIQGVSWAAGGHGYYAPIGIYSSPLGLLGLIPFPFDSLTAYILQEWSIVNFIVFFGTPVLWPAFALTLIYFARRGKALFAMRLGLAAHFAAAAITVIPDWSLFSMHEKSSSLDKTFLELLAKPETLIWVFGPYTLGLLALIWATSLLHRLER